MQARELDNYRFKGRTTNSNVNVSSWKYIQPKNKSKDIKNELTDTVSFFVIGWVGNKYFDFDLSELKIPPAMRNVDSRKEQRRQ